jgi:hypothetical protein
VKLTRRKLTLQLTPLLDLMLIVFFLQYLELRQRETATMATSAAIEEDVSRIKEELEAARRLNADYTRAIDALNQQVAGLEGEAKSLRDDAAAERARIDDSLEREKTLGRLVVELFGISKKDVDQVLDPNAQTGVTRSPQEIEELRKRFEQMSASQPGRMIRHLLLYEEVRKRCDVWELYVDPQHVVSLTTPTQTARLRLNLDDQGRPDLPRFEEELFQLYRSLPEPKSLVVILLTYDRQTRLIVTEALTEALPRITRKLSDDARGMIRFEYADLGIRVRDEGTP